MPQSHASSLRAVLAAAFTAAVSFMVSGPALATGASGTSAQASPTTRDFYLRAGLSLDRSRETRFQDRDCSAPRPGHFYGCGPGIDGAPHSALGDFGSMTGFELGMGYRATSSVRLEASVQYRPSFSFDGQHNYTRRAPRTVAADASSLSAFLAALIDLPAPGSPRIGSFRPFVGGGIGLSRIETDDTRIEFPITVVTIPGGDRTNFAWLLTAGAATPLGERATLEIAWRFTHSGTAETGRGTGRTACRTKGCDLESEYEVPETRARLRSHGLHLSVRYAF